MPPLSIYPVLPVEILSEIFSYLEPPSVRRVLCVNSLFRALAQPHAYQYGTVTELGLFFPGALHTYPFSAGFGPGLPVSPLSKEERKNIVQQLKRIDIKRHNYSDCEAQVRLSGLRPPKLDVWNIELHSWSSQRGTGDPQQNLWVPNHWKACPYVSQLLLWNPRAARKVVIKDVPRNSGHRYVEFIDNFAPDTYVSVVYSQPSPCTPEMRHDYTRSVLGDCELGMLGSRRLEVIFWTERPGQAWIPRCKYSTEQGRTGTCDPFERTIWSALAQDLEGYPTREVVVVNSAAILPAASSVLQHEVEMRTGQAQMQAQHSWCFGAELKHTERPRIPIEVEMYEFITMEEWIRRGGWEDAFTLEQIRPWLAKSQASAGARLPSVVHVYRPKLRYP